MNEFLVLIGQIFLIACLQSVIETYLDMEKKTYMAKIANFACYAGALYLLLQFIFNHLFREIFSIIQFAF